jgi:hypothetical protein
MGDMQMVNGGTGPVTNGPELRKQRQMKHSFKQMPLENTTMTTIPNASGNSQKGLTPKRLRQKGLLRLRWITKGGSKMLKINKYCF